MSFATQNRRDVYLGKRACKTCPHIEVCLYVHGAVNGGCGPGLPKWGGDGAKPAIEAEGDAEYVAARLAPREDQTPVTAADLDALREDVRGLARALRRLMVRTANDLDDAQWREHSEDRNAVVAIESRRP